MPTGNGAAASSPGRSGRPMPLGNSSTQLAQLSHLTKKHANFSTRRNRKSLASHLLKPQIYGLYFSAHWCGPCRKFTPQLVAYYNQIARDHPEFEIIFVSADKSADGMATYMRESGMLWPAIEYNKLANVPALQKYAGKGIPDLVIVVDSAKVLAERYL